jgi:ATP-dependent helicase/nuclease subunit A
VNIVRSILFVAKVVASVVKEFMMSLTKQQFQAAYTPDSVAVKAGAGTGKTHMLAERYQYFLSPDQGFTPLEIVAVTFTEKAATELRSRIRQTVTLAMSDCPNLIAEIEAAQISTFHALAARICREHPDEAVVPADFTLLDDIDGQVWQAEIILQALDQLPSEIYEHLSYSQMYALMSSFLRDPLTAEQALQCERTDWEPIINETREKVLGELWHHPGWQQACETLASYSAPGDKLDAIRQEALAAVLAAEQNRDIPNSLAIITGLKINVGSQKNWGGKDNLDEVKAAIKTLRELADKAVADGMVTLTPNEFDDRTEAMLPALRQAFSAVKIHLNQAKKLRRVLDFNDLEVHALQALEHSSVREYYARRWQVFMIDEFQDTNPIQSRLLELLTEKSKLTIVGDVKQSIYGFRRADVTVFENWCDRIMAAGGQSVILDLSFRTHHTLIQQINKIFQPVLGKQHQDLAGSRFLEPHPAPHLKICTVDDDIKPKPSIEKRRRVEAQYIADLIEKMLADQIQVHDKKSNELRSIQPSDIAILSRTWEPLDLYGQALSGRDIPIIQAGGGNLLATREAKDASALLRFLANPSDDLALIAVLRSPFFAVSDLTLFNLSQTLPDKTSWWKHIKTSGESTIPQAIQCLTRLLGERRIDPPTRLLQVADQQTGYTAVIANLPGSTRRVADWQGFLGFIRHLEQGTNDVLNVVRRLYRIISSEIQIPRPAIEGGNAVSLMTIHAAKGLEWPIVVVPDLTRAFGNDGSAVYFDPKLGVALKLEDDDGDKQKSALFTFLKYQKRQADQEEAKRVLYVAMTRVRDQLILTAPEVKGGGLDLLLPGLELPIELVSFVPELAQPVDLLKPQLPIASTLMLLKKMGTGISELPVTALTDYSYCPKRFEYRHIYGHPGYRSEVGSNSNAAEIGRLVHWVLEQNILDVERLVQANPGLSDEVVQEILDLAQSFRESEIYASYRHGKESWEHPVSLMIGSMKLNGSIDLLGSDFILDFKTDRIIQPEHHRFQLWAYAEATKKPAAHIAYLRHDKVYTFDTQALSSIYQEATILIESIQSDNFSPTPSVEICGICPYTEICSSY